MTTFLLLLKYFFWSVLCTLLQVVFLSVTKLLLEYNFRVLFTPLDFFTAEVAAFRASVYWNCKSDDDLSCSQTLNASFFSRIASLTSWFHLGVLFSLSPATLSRFRPQLSAADEMIVDLNSSHYFSTSSDTSGSWLNLGDILDANCFLTSLSSKASRLIR